MNLSLEDMKGEEWLDIPGFDGYFKVSNFGRVWALKRPVFSITGKFYYINERIRKQNLVKYYNTYTKDYTEQLVLNLRFEGKAYRFLINRLVYNVFIAPIDFEKDGKLVVHKDGDNCNNRVENLVLMNGTELYGHGLKLNRRPRSGTVVIKPHQNKPVFNEFNYPRAIIKYTLGGKKIAEYESIGQAAKENNSDRGALRGNALKKTVQLNGFVYRFKGDTYHGEHKDFSWEKPVTQYNIEGKKIRYYTSVKEASIKTGIDANTISKCALRKLRIGSGYVWRYEGDSYKGEYKGVIKNRAKPIVQYTLDGKEVNRFSSVTQATIATGFSGATLLDNAYKKTKISHGYVWRFEGDRYNGEHKNYRKGKPVTQFSLEEKKIKTYPTIEEAARQTGLTPDNIQKNTKGENKTAGGFIWRYATKKETKSLPSFQQSEYNGSSPTSKGVVKYSVEGKKLGEYVSISEAASHNKTSPSSISGTLDKHLMHQGFVWRSKGNRYRGELVKNPHANKAMQVTQYDLTGKKLRVFKSTKNAEKQTGISSSTISMVARGKFKSTGGFIWQYGDGKKKIDVNKHFASTRARIESISKPIVKYSLEGKRLAVFPSIAEAARSEAVRASIISRAVNKKKKSALGFIWKLKED
ncbi:MAG TPA: NUMOD1 domain-containing DNA-binding protein [Cyclobacteriaceae bacterium]